MSLFIKKLEQLHEEKVIEAIDLERCRFFQEQYSSVSDEVLKAIFLVGYRYRQGDICISIKEFAGQPMVEDFENTDGLTAPRRGVWKSRLIESSLAGTSGSFTPLIVDDDRVYLHKLWNQEQKLADSLIRLIQKPSSDVDFELLSDGLERLFNFGALQDETDWQKVAAAAAVLNHLTVISGGPGTGKTTTVVRILVLLLEQYVNKNFNIALAAPTGKAAARLKKSIEAQLENIDSNPSIIEHIPEKTFTLHRLLGSRKDSGSFKYNEKNKLPFDSIVVDEVSMTDQRLMNSLLNAMKSSARLILLGDKDQLASVEAGSVLGDICGDIGNEFTDEFRESLSKAGIFTDRKATQSNILSDHVVLLEKNYRFQEDSGIVKLTSAIKKGASDEAIDLLHNEKFDDIRLKQVEAFNDLWQTFEPKMNNYFKAVKTRQPFDVLFEQLQKFMVLCAHRRGPFGIQVMNREIEKKVRKKRIRVGRGEWYEGRPVIIRRNDYRQNLRNGDIGICRRGDDAPWVIVFPALDQSTQSEEREIRPERLPEFDTAYALTIHQGQGSEFSNVYIVLPAQLSKILSRELLYTAVTRARKTVTIFGRQKIISEIVRQKLERHSGLRELLME